MAFLVAILLVLLGVVALVAYGGTPHVGPTALCGPITFAGRTFTIDTDCRYLTIGELALVIGCFLIAFLILLSARPRSRGPE
ncbi:MAG TPA: hypothetical protein VFB58_15215 [Chloroflexota bacterium]|nr:hypothetical protein [Chloroflexota bacterium]